MADGLFLGCKIVIGVYGAHMADSVYMPPSSRATVMEMFPPGVFIRDAEMGSGRWTVWGTLHGGRHGEWWWFVTDDDDGLLGVL